MKDILKLIPKPIMIIAAVCFVLLYSFLAYLLITSKTNQHEASDPNAIYTEAAAAVFAGMTQTASNPDSLQIEEATTTPDSSGEMSVDKGLLNVEITLPASLFLDTDMSTFDTEAYVEKNGFKKAIVNEDGSLTVTMSKSRHKEVMEEYATDLETMFVEYVGAEETPYISNITSDSNFKKVIIDVDKIGYESTFDLTPLSIGLSAMFYQSLAGIDVHCEIIIRDKDTGETIASVIYPDAFEQ